jgi:radical SAM superfamily enzyme YgiQ (UPF0313 family)
MADIVIINPRFEASFWGLEYALPFFDAKANVPVACLPLLAALTPGEHRVTLIDENVEPIDYERCRRADLVCLTGMSVQRFRMKTILGELKQRNCFTVVGGPWITVQEDYFGNLVDVKFIGEAEDTWPQFLRDWERGCHANRYEQAERTDMTKVPVPRFDLLKMKRYAIGSVQFSRGCPFACEFCDIIVVFGRRPRLKTGPQVVAEIEALYAAGVDTAFIVDDNLIGNKKAIKEVLKDVIAWQRAKHYPMTFLTEASIDLADDPELLQMLVDASVRIVFVGIETPNEAALRETKKYQNVRRGPTMLEKVHTIQRAGIEVWSGMILGFDSDDAAIFDAQRNFIKEARIVTSMVGMLAAIPKTPLHARLTREGRLDPDDPPEHGTNVIPLQIGREQLKEGYLAVLRDLYQPTAYFDRLDDLYVREAIKPEQSRLAHLRRHPFRLLKFNALWTLEALGIFLRLMVRVPEAALRREYRRRFWGILKARREPIVLQIYAVKLAMHYHVHRLNEQMRGRGAIVNSF